MSDPTLPETMAEIFARHRGQEGPMLPILHSVMEAFGHIPEGVVPLIAEELNLGRAEVHGVISFYHDFRKEPAGHHLLKICRAEACQAVGANALTERVLSKLGIGWGETTPDGRITVEPVYCLGLCACGPAAMVGNRVIGRADEAKIEEALA
ncbi:formate dehydrogenase subunit gamma [Salibaculum griseiflavum]|jgi:formate dehydrogenase subunit gamma|uniref:Formate dehydrogenase subunit gamma n=1 Tax=Salibaculum griseiflavum TaxID=1914409 RepID=A0A2V1P4F6_9RHOB|nr:formate dehydrogenase subunit gamma [Salibaculum griseiflavum]PWG17363.1 formate dehydrogenase subunit gamma [Salibaculum griseiflavum]